MILSDEERRKRKLAKQRRRLPRLRSPYSLNLAAFGLVMVLSILWWIFDGSNDAALAIRELWGALV